MYAGASFVMPEDLAQRLMARLSWAEKYPLRKSLPLGLDYRPIVRPGSRYFAPVAKLSNAQALRDWVSMQKATPLQSTDITSSLLSTEQAHEFVRQVFASTPTLSACRTIPMFSKTRNIDRLAIGQRLTRQATQNTAFTTTTKPTTSTVTLTAVDLQLPWEITWESLRYNIERESLEDTLIQMMTTQVGVDLSELAWRGNTNVPAATTLNQAGVTGASPAAGGTLTLTSTANLPTAGTLLVDTGGSQERIRYDGISGNVVTVDSRGADGTTAQSHANGVAVVLAGDGLLTATNGWLLKGGVSHSLDGSTVNAGNLRYDHFSGALRQLPSKYLSNGNTEGWMWFINPLQRTRWIDYLATRATPGGDLPLYGIAQGPMGGSPYGWPFCSDATFPTGSLFFTHARNLVVGMTLEIRVSRDISSRDVLSRRTRYYQIDFAADVQIELEDATVKVNNLNA